MNELRNAQDNAHLDNMENTISESRSTRDETIETHSAKLPTKTIQEEPAPQATPEKSSAEQEADVRSVVEKVLSEKEQTAKSTQQNAKSQDNNQSKDELESEVRAMVKKIMDEKEKEEKISRQQKEKAPSTTPKSAPVKRPDAIPIPQAQPRITQQRREPTVPIRSKQPLSPLVSRFAPRIINSVNHFGRAGDVHLRACMMNKVEIYARRLLQQNKGLADLDVNSRINTAAEATVKSCTTEFESFNKGPSFKCENRTDPTEVAICNSAILSFTDVSFDNAVHAAKAMLPAKKRQITELLKKWAAARNSCGADVNCIMTVYNQGFYIIENL